MRDEILKLLSEREMTVTEISKALGISKATVSHHIERLQKDGLVRVAKEERIKNFIKRYYTVALPNGGVSGILIESFKKSANKRDRAETFRNTVRILGYVLLKTSPYLFRRAGFEVGYALGYEEAKLDDLGDLWENLGLGKVSTSRDSMTVEDCYFCSGLPKIGNTYCLFDEGLISGFMTRSAGRRYGAKEVKCWGLGDELCEFVLFEF